MKIKRKVKHIIAIGGGKGGVGKSVFSIALSAALADIGQKVVVADFDLGGANLHTYLGKMPGVSIADFLNRKVNDFNEIITPTDVENLGFISGGDFAPGIANPAHWMKLKVINRLKAIDADYLVIDLGAGVNYNTLDLFCVADKGIIVTMPEPGAIINAYSFIKGALLRKIQVVFGRHPQIGPELKTLMNGASDETTNAMTLFANTIGAIDPEMNPLIDEIIEWFTPFIVANKAEINTTYALIDNLQKLCLSKLGAQARQIGAIPPVRGINHYLTQMPAFFRSANGKPMFLAASLIAKRLDDDLENIKQAPDKKGPAIEMDDERIVEISELIDSLEDSVFINSNRNLWKLRLYFKPQETLDFLTRRGVVSPALNRSGDALRSQA